MPRPRSDPEQKLKAYGHYLKFGAKPSLIHAALKDEIGEYHAVSLRTVSSWLKEFKDYDTAIDEPFEWHRIGEYQSKRGGIPWEASEFLLSVKRFISRNAFSIRFLGTGEPPIGSPNMPRIMPELFRLTVREARWIWRVHLAAPRMNIDEVIGLGKAFALREQAHDVLGQPFDVADLEAYLSLSGWDEDEKERRVYEGAVTIGLVPALRRYDVVEIRTALQEELKKREENNEGNSQEAWE